MTKYEDLPDRTSTNDPNSGTNRDETIVNFCPRCSRITTNSGNCDRCLAQGKEFEIENVEAR